MQKNFLICFLTFVRPRDVQKIYGVSRQSLWRYVRSGRLEAPTEISPSIRGWSRAKLDAFFGIIPDTVNNHTLLDDRLVCEEIVPTSIKKQDKKRGVNEVFSI